MSAVDKLAEAFLDHSLPKEDWTHHAHLKVGLWHLLRFDKADALERLRLGIQTFNIAKGGQNSDTSGYHETITRFYVFVIDRFLADRDQGLPINQLAESLIDQYGAKDLPLRFYSRERLFTVEARRGWVEPDLQPLS